MHTLILIGYVVLVYVVFWAGFTYLKYSTWRDRLRDDIEESEFYYDHHSTPK